MGFSSISESPFEGLLLRRLGTFVLVGLLLMSAVGGTVASSGIVAAQPAAPDGNNTTAGNTTTSGGSEGPRSNPSWMASSGGGESSTGGGNNSSTPANPVNATDSGNNSSIPADPVNATIKDFKRQNLGYTNLSSEDKQQFREILRKMNNTDSKQGRFVLLNEINKRIDWPRQNAKQRRKVVRRNFGAGTAPQSTPANPVNATITQFKQENLGYANLSSSAKNQFRSKLQQLNGTAVRNPGRITKEQQRILSDIGRIFPNDGNHRRRQKIVKKNFGIATNMSGKGYGAAGPNINIDIPKLLGGKLDALADKFRKGAANILTNLYNLAFSTPVPENSGWKGVLGTPVDTKSNQTFYTLFQKLLVEKLYPVTYSLLTVGIVFMAISLAGNPFLSHHQVVDYLIKLVLGIMYWAFAWTGVTLMHGVVNNITMWIRPSPEVMGALVTHVEALSAGATAAYFAGSGGILAALFGLGLELGMRRVLLLYVFPYIFPVLLLVLYLAPWRRLRAYASMGIWQYVNVLTMVIPMAVLLKAAAVVSLGLKGKSSVVAMFILVALFLVAATIPFITTYFYIQMPGTAKKGAKKGVSSARGRIGDAKDKMGWGDDESASESTTTASASPGDRGEEAVDAATDTSSGLSTSGTVDSTSDTTASQVRELYEQQHTDPMSDEAMLQAYFEDRSRPSTLQEKSPN
jgi:hypothetical protein